MVTENPPSCDDQDRGISRCPWTESADSPWYPDMPAWDDTANVCPGPPLISMVRNVNSGHPVPDAMSERNRSDHAIRAPTAATSATTPPKAYAPGPPPRRPLHPPREAAR